METIKTREKLKLEGKINRKFEILLEQISLEDIIQLKLELIYDQLSGRIPIRFKEWAERISKNAMIKFDRNHCERYVLKRFDHDKQNVTIGRLKRRIGRPPKKQEENNEDRTDN